MSRRSRRALALLHLALLVLPLAGAQQVPDNTPPTLRQCREGNPFNAPECRPDLIGVAPTYVSKDVRYSPNAQVCASFVNIGRTTVATPFHMEVVVDGLPMGDVLVEPPAPEGAADVPGYQTGQGNGPYCIELTLSAGEHSFFWRVDSRNTVDETNETNNAMRPRYFEVGDLPTIDLAVVAITVTPRYPRPEDQNQIMIARVRNIGEGRSRNTTLTFEDENGVLGTAKVPALYPRQSTDLYLITHPPLRSPGNFTLTAYVDPDNDIKEVNESNNALLTPYRVPEHPAPDLYVQDVSYYGNFTARRGIYVNVTHANQGDRGVLSPTVAIYDDDVQLGNQTVKVLNVGQNATSQFRLVLQAGYHPLRIVVDPDGRIGERNEKNNVYYLNLTVFPGLTEHPTPNLVVERVTVAPDDPRPGEPVRISALITNVGDQRSNATEAEFFVNGRTLGNVLVPPIREEASVVVSKTWDGGTEGVYDFLVRADPRNKIAEIDEGDNELALSFVVQTTEAPPPEPAPVEERDEPVTPPTLEPPPIENVSEAVDTGPRLIPGQLVLGHKQVPGGLRGIAALTMRNPSLDPVPRAVVTFKVDGQILKEVLVPEVRGAAITNVTTGEIDIPSGRHNLTAEVRIVGSTATETVSRIYELEAGPKEETPGFALVAALAALALVGALRRRR